MPWPIDLSFPPWVSLQTPGASDLDKIQDAIVDLANPPSAKWQNTNPQVILTSPTLGLANIKFGTKIWQTDSGMTVSNSTGSPGSSGYLTDRIFLTYVGEWEVGCMLETRSNNNAGISYLTLNLIFGDNSGITIIDKDDAFNNSVTSSTLHCRTNVVVNATQVANGIGVLPQYAQNSGGNNTLVSTDPSWPYLYARWVSKGGQ